MSETERQLVRLSVNMNADTADELETLSRTQNVSKTEIVRRAIALMKFVEDEQRAGRQIVTMRRDNERDWRVLVLV